MTAESPTMPAPSAKRSRRPTFAALCVVAFLSCCIAVALALLAPAAAPVKAGSADVFWNLVCGDRLYPPDSLGFSDAYVAPDRSFVYEASGIDTITLYKVPDTDVKARFESALARLAEGRSLRPYVVVGYDAWRNRAADDDGEPDGLVTAIDKARWDEIKKRSPQAFSSNQGDRRQVAELLRRARWYWATVVFEWAFLTGLLLWITWPVFRGGGWLRWAAHLAAAPFLFFLPTYFHYADGGYSLPGGGGILYPWLVRWAPNCGRDCPLCALDAWIVERLPPVLEPLSPQPSAWVYSARLTAPGPTQTAVVGLGLALGVLLVPVLARLPTMVRKASVLNAARDQPELAEALKIRGPVSANQSPPAPFSSKPG